jgi:hypothetical protein
MRPTAARGDQPRRNPLPHRPTPRTPSRCYVRSTSGPLLTVTDLRALDELPADALPDGLAVFAPEVA